MATDSSFADINTLIAEQWEKASGLPKPFLYAALLMARVLTGVDITQAQPAHATWHWLRRGPCFSSTVRPTTIFPRRNLDSLQAADPAAETWVIEGANCLHSEGFNADPAAYGARIVQFFANAIGAGG